MSIPTSKNKKRKQLEKERTQILEENPTCKSDAKVFQELDELESIVRNQEEDVLIYEKGITAEIDSNDRSILYLKDDSSDAVKTILLSGSSDLFWSEQSIQAGF